MLRDAPRILCIASLPPETLERRVDAAVAAGFDGISLWRQHWLEARESGLDETAIRALIERLPRGAVMAEGLTRWWADPVEDAAARREAELIFDFAEAVGADCVCTVLMDATPHPVTKLATAYRNSCDMAAARGIRLALEFVPWSTVDTLARAWEVVERADRTNGGILVDSWHWARTGSDLEALARVPADRIFTLQLNDAPAVAMPDLLQETMHARLLPGAGDIDLPRLLQALDDHGVDCPVAAEVFSDALFAQPLAPAAQALAASLRRVLG